MVLEVTLNMIHRHIKASLLCSKRPTMWICLQMSKMSEIQGKLHRYLLIAESCTSSILVHGMHVANRER